MGLQLGIHAAARVGDLQHGIRAGNDVGMTQHCGAIQSPVPGLDGQLAAIGHGVPCINHQVEDHLFDLTAIRFYGSGIGRE